MRGKLLRGALSTERRCAAFPVCTQQLGRTDEKRHWIGAPWHGNNSNEDSRSAGTTGIVLTTQPTPDRGGACAVFALRSQGNSPVAVDIACVVEHRIARARHNLGHHDRQGVTLRIGELRAQGIRVIRIRRHEFVSYKTRIAGKVIGLHRHVSDVGACHRESMGNIQCDTAGTKNDRVRHHRISVVQLGHSESTVARFVIVRCLFRSCDDG